MSEIEDILKALLSDGNNGDSNGSSDNQTQPQTETESVNADMSGDSENSSDKSGGDDIFGGINIDMFMKIGEIMSKLGEQDKNTELLLALKPHLRNENQAKIDTAVKLFRLISLLPYLKDSGIFDNLL